MVLRTRYTSTHWPRGYIKCSVLNPAYGATQARANRSRTRGSTPRCPTVPGLPDAPTHPMLLPTLLAYAPRHSPSVSSYTSWRYPGMTRNLKSESESVSGSKYRVPDNNKT
eukprot:2236889-Rhodomonas_salina.2